MEFQKQADHTSVGKRHAVGTVVTKTFLIKYLKKIKTKYKLI